MCELRREQKQTSASIIPNVILLHALLSWSLKECSVWKLNGKHSIIRMLHLIKVLLYLKEKLEVIHHSSLPVIPWTSSQVIKSRQVKRDVQFETKIGSSTMPHLKSKLALGVNWLRAMFHFKLKLKAWQWPRAATTTVCKPTFQRRILPSPHLTKVLEYALGFSWWVCFLAARRW